MFQLIMSSKMHSRHHVKRITMMAAPNFSNDKGLAGNKIAIKVLKIFSQHVQGTHYHGMG